MIAADRETSVPQAKPSRVFRKSRPMMPRQDAARQARVAALAWSTFGDRERVMAFLNADHPQLGGRPLDLAIASDAGLNRVEGVLAELAVAAPSR